MGYCTSFVVALLYVQVAYSLECKDEQGVAVDWFIAYKLPRIETYPQEFVKEGIAYAFLTSNSPQKWTFSSMSIADPNSMMGRTLSPLYDKTSRPEILRLLYNDQSPGEPVSLTHGHTKGVVLAQHDQGLWLVHSVPHYPPPGNASYGYPTTGHHYGQSLLCISFNSNQLSVLGQQLMYNYPKVYFWNAPNDLIQKWPSLQSVANGVHVKNAPFYSQSAIVSKNGVAFQTFAKTAQFGKDLYSDWVSPALGVNLLVETWPNGPGRLPSTCKDRFSVLNVLGLKVSGVVFRDQQDHSKWAVQQNSSLSASHSWLCIGDINRMASQELRAGGTTCFDLNGPRKAFLDSVTKVEVCEAENLNFV